LALTAGKRFWRDDGGARLIGVCQGGAAHRAKARATAFPDLPVDTEPETPQTFAGAPLAEPHGPQMQPIGEFLGSWPRPGLANRQVIEKHVSV